MPLDLSLLNVPRMIGRAAQILLEDMPKTSEIELVDESASDSAIEVDDAFISSLITRELGREERLGIAEMEMAEQRIALIREIADAILGDEIGKLVDELNLMEAGKPAPSTPRDALQ